ncbi:hypothetical protein EC973_009023 [Apophysomyces ossiformis]|uniref:Conserved oligomeric Golgi complex subunit 7 n=1 Tax=Apophysomyces ossiformis TaxID=679940 RepID=A0A8H7BM46_9FUNG|nr:hypothetical protein EC973_009023 [Apophysomyces ossiformis]
MAPSTVDITTFSDPEFDPKTWINALLESHSSVPDSTATTTEQDATILVTKLQLASEQTSRKVGQVTDNVIKSMPRILYDLKLISDSAKATKEGVESVKTNLGVVENDTATALEKLRQLHLVKTRMEQCRSALREAENWRNLEAETSRLTNEDYEGAAARLQSAQQSLDVFQHTPEYEPRRRLLKKLQDDLQQALKPKVMEALKAHDAVECHKFYKVFGRIGRAEDFVDLYFEVRNPDAVLQWKNVGEGDKFDINMLDAFYKSMFVLLSEEYVWCASIFPDPKPIVQAFVQNILQSLDPSLDDRLQTVKQTNGPHALPIMVSAFSVTEAFGSSLERLFAKPPVITASAESSSFNVHIKSHARRHSHGNQLTLVPLVLRHADTNAWSYVLYEPFLPIQSQYASLEGQYLTAQMISMFNEAKSHQKGSMELAQLISSEVIGKVFSLAKESLNRCLALTHGYGGVEWLKMLNNYVDDMKVQLRAILAHIEKNCETTVDTNPAEENPSRISISSDATDDLGLDAELQNNDWSDFQVGLRLLGICRIMEIHLHGLEENVCRVFEGVRRVLQDDEPPLTPGARRRETSVGAEPVRTHERKRSASTAREIQEHSHGEKFPQASLALLRTSSLNTHELHKLISQASSVIEEEKPNIVNQMLYDGYQSIERFTEECQRFLHEAIHAPISRHLAGVATNPIWAAEAPDNPTRRNASSIEMPQFSLSPNEYITRVGEQLLMLPQQFEVYSDDDCLAYHTDTIPFIGDDTIELEEPVPTEQVVQLWTTSVARGTMKTFLDEVFEIRNMSQQGGRQLRTDIEYLVNVLAALEVQPVPELLQVYELFDLDEQQIIKELWVARENPSKENKMLKQVAEMRGVVLLEL